MTYPVKIKNKFDPHDTTFSTSGLLNFIIRYGGGRVVREQSALQAIDRAVGGTGRQTESGIGNPPNFAPVRKMVLETSDTTPEAQEVLEKIYSFSGDVLQESFFPKPLTSEEITRIKRTRNSLKCSPLYNVIPEIIVENPKAAFQIGNVELQEVGKTGIIAQIKSLDLELIANPNYKAGAVPVYQGSVEIDFFHKNKNRGTTSVLQAIAENQHSLGYMFQLNRAWSITLRNKPILPQTFKNKEDRQAYADLTSTQISFSTSTIRYEMVDWKPHENRAIFRINFAPGVESREKIFPDGQGVDIVSNVQGSKTNKYSLQDAIISKLIQNGSFFMYDIRRRPRSPQERKLKDKGWLGKTIGLYGELVPVAVIARKLKEQAADSNEDVTYVFYPEGRTNKDGAIRNTKQYLKDTEAISSKVAKGSFFLFRSLLIAVIQTFYKEHTLLDSNYYQDVLINKETFNKLLILLDESNIPNETGTFVLSKNGTDVRNSFETVVVEFRVFNMFMQDLYSKYERVTLDFIIEKIFNELLPRVLKWSISREGIKKQTYNSLGSGKLKFNMSSKIIDGTFGQGYSLSIRDVNRNNLDLSTAGIKTTFQSPFKGTDKLHHMSDIKLNKWGKTKIKRIGDTSKINNALIGYKDKDSVQRAAIIIEKINMTSEAESSEADRNALKLKKEFFLKTNQQLRDRHAIINLDWYDKEKQPTDNLNSRIIPNGSASPFRFSAINNKHLDTIRRTAAGETPFIRKVFNVDFAVADVLGIVPYQTKFMFKPSFFGLVSGDPFGFSGVYRCVGSSISYDQASAQFVTNVKLQYERQAFIENKRDRIAADIKKETAKKQQIIKDRQNKIDQLQRAKDNLNVAFNQNLHTIWNPETTPLAKGTLERQNKALLAEVTAATERIAEIKEEAESEE